MIKSSDFAQILHNLVKAADFAQKPESTRFNFALQNRFDDTRNPHSLILAIAWRAM